MWQTLQRALVIVIAGAGLGWLSNTVSPRRIPYVAAPKPAPKPEQLMTLAEARELWGTGLGFFLDARAPEDFAAGHIANAFNLPAEGFEGHFPRIAPMLAPDSAIIVYCDGTECELSLHVLDKLKQMGFQQVRMLTNGWTSWKGAGLPTEKGARQL